MGEQIFHHFSFLRSQEESFEAAIWVIVDINQHICCGEILAKLLHVSVYGRKNFKFLAFSTTLGFLQKGQKFEVFSLVHGNMKQFGQYFPTIYALVSLNYHPNISLEALLLAVQEQKMMKTFGLTLWVFHCLTQVRDSSSQGCKGTLMGPFRLTLESMTQSHDTGVGASSTHPLKP